jgi:hypothetical protein
MLREPRPIEKKVEVRKDKKGRFHLVRLEERIAPEAHYNPQGTKVGHSKPIS